MSPWMLALLSSSPALTTKTFTSSQPFIVPAGVTHIDMVGKGSDGTPSTVGHGSDTLLDVRFIPSGTAGSGSFDWTSLQGAANNNLSALNSGGSVTVLIADVDVYPDQTNHAATSNGVRSNVIPGSASVIYNGGWATSGPATASGSALFLWDYTIDAAPGASASGFGQSFPGGGAGSPAPTTSAANVAVVPLQSYQIVVPSGGSITITYYQ